MAKIILSIPKLGVCAVLGGLLWLSACNSKESKATDGAKGDSTVLGPLAFDTLKAAGVSKNEMYSFDLKVPQIKIDGKPDAILQNINATFRKYVTDRQMNPTQLDSCETELKKEGMGVPKRGYYADFNVYRNDGKIFGAGISGDDYEGGAHGLRWYRPYAFDLSTGKNLKAPDVFKPDFLPRLNALLKIKLKALEATTMFLEPISEYKGKEDVEALKFLLYADSVVVIYDDYEITPYVQPPPFISLSTKEIKDLLRPEVFEKGWVKKD